MKKNSLALVLSWYAATLTCLVFASLFLIHISLTHPLVQGEKSNYRMYQAQPSFGGVLQQVNINKADGRALIVANFLQEHRSPLSSLAPKFVTEADRQGIDYRLMPAIAMQESQGGKRLPKESFNPFGYGIYGQKLLRFNSFEEAIERVARGLKQDYIDQGLATPDEIMYKYTPSSPEKGGPWAIGVSAFMEQLI